jgi:hypothetical protein
VQRLYLLGFTQDLKGVVFSDKRGGRTATYWVPVDDTFLAAIEKLGRARRDRSGPKRGAEETEEPAPAKAPALFPAVGRSERSSRIPASEIQQLLREGRTIDTVAKAAGASRAWVERLSEPINNERTGVIRLAQRAYMPRSRLGRSGLPLGQAVQQNLEERRATVGTLEAIEDGWDARATRSGPWRVRLKFTHRGNRRTAEWDYIKSTGQLSARNRLATELGWWPPPPEPKRPKSPEEEAEDGEERTDVQRTVVRPSSRQTPRRRRQSTGRSRPGRR